jgi:hypothetical protein
VVEEPFWREQFAASGGTAVMGPQLEGLDNLTIDSGEWPCVAAQCIISVQCVYCIHALLVQVVFMHALCIGLQTWW